MHLADKLKKVKILMIDNDALIRNSLSLFFQCEGGHFLAVDSAEKGLEALTKEKYDVIISDFTLPTSDALSFFRLVDKRYPDVLKVLIISIFTGYMIREAIMIGVRNFIQKPFTSRTIEKSLYHLLEKSSAQTGTVYLNGEAVRFSSTQCEHNTHPMLRNLS